VYQHVLARREALETEGIELSGYQLAHRRREADYRSMQSHYEQRRTDRFSAVMAYTCR
jgi:hypothetical protein